MNDQIRLPDFTNELWAPPTGNMGAYTSEAAATPNATIAIPPHSATCQTGQNGQRMSQTVNGQTTTFQYNSAGQLTMESSTAKTVTHEYDQLGNEWRRTTTPTGGTATQEIYGYNHLNRMSTYVNNGTGANWQYSFWPTGERQSKMNNATQQKELYAPRFQDVAADYEQTGSGPITHKNSYVQGLGIDSKSTRIDNLFNRHHYVGNQVGTVAMTLDDTGAAVDKLVRDAWGNTLSGSSTERYGFAQREHDGESSLIYMRHRMYDPKIGRFTQTDPISDNRSSVHYCYGNNNPAINNDPQGLETRFFVDKQARTIRVVTRILVTGGDSANPASMVARRLADPIHKRWNNEGAGWLVGSPGKGIYTLTFEPEIYVGTASDIAKPEFNEFDVWTFKANERARTLGVPNKSAAKDWSYDDEFRLTNTADLNREISPTYDQRHQTFVGQNSTEWDYGHEYGHLLGMIDRYEKKVDGIRGEWPDPDDRANAGWNKRDALFNARGESINKGQTLTEGGYLTIMAPPGVHNLATGTWTKGTDMNAQAFDIRLMLKMTGTYWTSAFLSGASGNLPRAVVPKSTRALPTPLLPRGTEERLEFADLYK